MLLLIISSGLSFLSTSTSNKFATIAANLFLSFKIENDVASDNGCTSYNHLEDLFPNISFTIIWFVPHLII